MPRTPPKQAAERGVKIFTVGLGDSREGARIPVRDASGRLTYLAVRRAGEMVQAQRSTAQADRPDHRRRVHPRRNPGLRPGAGLCRPPGRTYPQRIPGRETQTLPRAVPVVRLVSGVLLLLVEMGIASSQRETGH